MFTVCTSGLTSAPVKAQSGGTIRTKRSASWAGESATHSQRTPMPRAAHTSTSATARRAAPPPEAPSLDVPAGPGAHPLARRDDGDDDEEDGQAEVVVVAGK